MDSRELVRKVPLGFQKNGNIAWVIYFNYNQAGLSGSKVTPYEFKDIIGEGHQLVTSSIAAYDVKTPIIKDSETGELIRNTEHDAYNYDVTSFLQKYATTDGFNYTSETYEVPGSNTNAYYIYMETKPTDPASTRQYTNYTYMSTSYEGVKAWEDEDTAVISKDENSSGDADGSVVLTKRDTETKAVLAGAEFKLVNQDTGVTLFEKLVTDQSGQIALQNLTVGRDYAFVETKAPTGYVLNTAPITFQVKSGSVETLYVDAFNTADTGGVQLIKYEEGNKTKHLAGAQFDLYKVGGAKVKEALTTNSEGKLTASGLSPGSYYLIETKAPTGYELDQTKLNFEIKAGQTADVQLEKANRLQKASIKIIKQDRDTKAKLAGAEFEWKDTETGKIGQFTVGSDGSYTLSNLLVNRTYEIKETKAPAGYELDPTVHKVKLTSENANKTVTVTVNNTSQMGTLKIVKQDRDTKTKLAGAEFQWKDTLTGAIGTFKTGADGSYTLPGKLWLNRTYEIKETKAPAGYELDPTVHKVKLTPENANKTVTVTVNNTSQMGTLKIVKQDRDTKAKLAGAEFQWKDT
ncbi:SpaA isopeptide-forming pilin-related protein [Listeria aquatica]|uniref:SpaA isopeptide-forming pilin-related protein n=1 Tax=Listeria aquatica TaxID=1494960 RepID=UPI0031F4EE03